MYSSKTLSERKDQAAQPIITPGTPSTALSLPAVPFLQMKEATAPVQFARKKRRHKWGKKMSLGEFHRFVDQQQAADQENEAVGEDGMKKDTYANFAAPQGPIGEAREVEGFGPDEEQQIRDAFQANRDRRPGGLGISIPVPNSPVGGSPLGGSPVGGSPLVRSPVGSPRNNSGDETD